MTADRYTQELIDPVQFSKSNFLEHIKETADLVGAPYNADRCELVLRTFGNDFETNVVQWKLTDDPRDGLYYRFLSTDLEDPVKRAKDAGLIADVDKPLENLQRNVVNSLPCAVRSGVDFEAKHGLSKVWTYTSPIPVNLAMGIEGLPPALLQHQQLFSRFRFDGVGFIASDFLHRSMNIYFGWIMSPVTRTWLEDLCAATGTENVDPNTIEEIIRNKNNLRGVGMTFDWESPDIKRWAIYQFGLPYQDAAAEDRLPTLSPRLELLRNEAISLNEDPCYHMAWSFGKQEHYKKLEKNYARDVHYFLAQQRGLKI